jgi:uncharacterized membrane protein SpoIIM required for sporulation
MSPSTQVGIFAPAIMAGLGFLMSWGKARDGLGKFSEEKAQFLICMWLVLMAVAYVLVWYKDIVRLFP